MQSEQIRREADDTGPFAEMDHWRHMSARFSSIIDQMKTHHCKMTINVLNVAKSKVLKVCHLNLISLHHCHLKRISKDADSFLNLLPDVLCTFIYTLESRFM